jgi:hypothetical protein
MQRTVRRFFHRLEGHKANVVRLADFFKRSAHTHVTRESLAAIGGQFKGGDGRGHGTPSTSRHAT